MGTTERAEAQDPSHAKECIEEDRGSVLEGPQHKRRDSAEDGAGRGVGDCEEETEGVERKFRKDGQ